MWDNPKQKAAVACERMKRRLWSSKPFRRLTKSRNEPSLALTKDTEEEDEVEGEAV